MVIDVSLVQFSNALKPISIRDDGNEMVVRAEQFLNADAPMLLICCPKLTVASEVQL